MNFLEKTGSPPPLFQQIWHSIRARILSGLLLILPIVITTWVVVWMFSTLQRFVIDPLARLVMWRVRRGNLDAVLPSWFENFIAPLIAIIIALLSLYLLGFLVRSRLQRAMDGLLLRLPIISSVYDGVRKVFQTLDKKGKQTQPQKVVLVPFPHPGIKVPAFVTSSCRDMNTGKVLLGVYVPTTPVPTSGYFLLVPEEDTLDPGWTMEQALQAIISGGLTCPQEVRFYS